MSPASLFRHIATASALTAVLWTAMPVAAPAQGTEKFIITKLAESRTDALPEGELYWHVERFGSPEAAEAAATAGSLVGEFDGDAWLFTLADRSADGSGGTPVAKIGPVARIDAAEYILRINSAVAPRGARTSIHSHPGTEAFLVLSGQLTQRTPFGSHVVNAGGTLPGVPDQAMQVMSSGDEDLRQLVMFVVDAARPFSEKKQNLH